MANAAGRVMPGLPGLPGIPGMANLFGAGDFASPSPGYMPSKKEDAKKEEPKIDL